MTSDPFTTFHPYPEPPLLRITIEPLPTRPKWFPRILWWLWLLPKLPARRERQRNLNALCAELQPLRLEVWRLENALKKRDWIRENISRLEHEPAQAIAMREQTLRDLEIEVRDEFAAYQLKRDYWGDMNPETLRAEYRTFLRAKPQSGLLRESTSEAVREIVGTGVGLPALPPPIQTNAAHLARFKAMLVEVEAYIASDVHPQRIRFAVADRGKVYRRGKPFTNREAYIYFEMKEQLYGYPHLVKSIRAEG